MVLLPAALSGGVEAVGGGRVGDVAVAACASHGVCLEEAAVVVVERVEEDLGVVLEVVGEAPISPEKDQNNDMNSIYILVHSSSYILVKKISFSKQLMLCCL